MRAMKWILLIAVILIVIAVVVVSAIVSSYDYNKLKPRVAEAVKDATGRELNMGGDIKLGIGLRPTLIVEDVSLQNAPWGSEPEMVAVKRFEVQVALLPLIVGDIEVRRLILIEPNILIETDASGNSNLDFEKAPKAEKPEEAVPPENKGELPGLQFHQVRIENGRLAYRDGESGDTHTFILENLSATSEGKTSPISVNIKGAYNSKPFEVEGTVGPIAQLIDADQPWSVKLAVKAGGAVVSLDGEIKHAMSTRGIDLNVTVEGQSLVEVAQLADVSGVPDLGPFKAAANVTDPAAKTYKLSDLEMNFGENDLAGSVEIGLAGQRPHLKAKLTSQQIDVRPLLEMEKEEGMAVDTDAKAERKRIEFFPMSCFLWIFSSWLTLTLA